MATPSTLMKKKKVLTPSELEHLKLICDGHNNFNVAFILNESQYVVEKSRTKLAKKLGAKSSLDLLKIALRQKLVKLEELDEFRESNA